MKLLINVVFSKVLSNVRLGLDVSPTEFAPFFLVLVVSGQKNLMIHIYMILVRDSIMQEAT